MSRPTAGEFVKAVAVKAVLDRLTRRAPSVPVAAPPSRTDTQARPARAVPAIASLVVGATLMLLFDSTVTRVIGVLGLIGFVVAGAFAIADPRWLGAAPELGHGDPPDASPTGRPG
jgi:hypothetical protein